jgi:hypothetical protein
MSHLKAHEVSVRARAKANAQFGFLGFTHFASLVRAETIGELHLAAMHADYTRIFNKFGNRSDSKRAAAKAGHLGDHVMREVLGFLKTVLIAGPSHKIEMARGASFLRSLPGVKQQDTHSDFDFEDIVVVPGFRRCKPFSIWIPLSPKSSLVLGGTETVFSAGDVVVFAGDCHHSGAANRTRNINYRLFCYVPTRDFDVPWTFSQCPASVQKQAVKVEDKDDFKRLMEVTNPINKKWDPAEHVKYLYDQETATFYDFSVPLWIGGLDTAVPNSDPYAPERLSSLPLLNPDTGVPHCPHFSVEDFIPDRDEKKILNDFRAQCVHCQPRRKRAREGA